MSSKENLLKLQNNLACSYLCKIVITLQNLWSWDRKKLFGTGSWLDPFKLHTEKIIIFKINVWNNRYNERNIQQSIQDRRTIVNQAIGFQWSISNRDMTHSYMHVKYFNKRKYLEITILKFYCVIQSNRIHENVQGMFRIKPQFLKNVNMLILDIIIFC